MNARCLVLLLTGLWGLHGLPFQALGADATVYGIFKSQQFFQTNSGMPVAPAYDAFAFQAFVAASDDYVVTNATVKPSNSTPLRQLLGSSDQAVWRYEERFDSAAELNSVYPSGTILSPANYTVTIKTAHDGTQTPSLKMGAASVLGNPPTLQVTNFDAAQSILPGVDFLLRWDAAGGQSIDIVQLVVFNSASNIVYASPEPLAPGALTGQSNSVVIPGAALVPISHYAAQLFIARPLGLDPNSYPGATGLPALVKTVDFPLATRTAPMRPRLEVVSAQANPFQLRYIGEPNLVYQIQFSDDLLFWSTLFTTNSPTGTGIYTDTSSVEANKRFYRVLLGQ